MKSKWPIKQLSKVATINMGQSPKGSSYNTSGEGVPLVNGPVEFGKTPFSCTKKTKFTTEPTKMCKVGDLILCVRGSTTGRMNIAGFDSCIGRGVASIRSEQYQDWINFFIHANRENIYHLGSGATFPNVSGESLSKLEIPLPPIEEQKRIVSIVDNAFEGIDRAIANTERAIAGDRELFESYLNAIFTRKGQGWTEKKLGDICSIKHGFAFKGEFFTNEKSDYILLTPGSFHESGGYREQGEKTKYYVGEMPGGYILNDGDFLFAMTEQAVGLLGSSLIVPESDRFLHNQRLGLVQVFAGIEWHNEFFFHQFNSWKFRYAVQSTASGVKVRHTSPNKLGAILVFFPESFAEQKNIADNLNELKAETQRLEAIHRQKLAALKELKQSILQKAFTGELSNDPKAAQETINP